MSHLSSGLGSKAIQTFALLDEVVTVLGGTKLSFYPILSGFGTELFPYGSGSDGLVGTASAALESVFDPLLHVGSIYSYYNDSSASANVQFADNNAYSFTDGADDDAAFSVGGWFMLTEALGTARTFLGKWDATGGAEAREWKFAMDTSGNLEFSLYDESANASEVGTGASDVVVPWVWNFVVATYDGTEATPDVHLYRNAVDQLSAGTTTEAGAYVGMENLTTVPAIGADIFAGSVENEFEGRIALPFITGTELTAANVTTLYGLGRTLLGV